MNSRILIIDDNKEIHRDFHIILRGDSGNTEILDNLLDDILDEKNSRAINKSGYDLDFAIQGKEGVEKAVRALEDEKPFAVAFVDMRMPPGWNGLETIEHLWAADPHVQVVICSAYSDYSWDEINLRFGITDKLLILKKPFDPAEVAQLSSALSEKWALAKQAAIKINEIEQAVKNRTQELADTNARLLHEIAEREQAEKEKEALIKKLDRLSKTDRLTGVFNRLKLDEQLESMLNIAERYNRPFSVLLLDIDHFKTVNDTFGHQSGDKVLVGLAGILQENIRKTDLVGRWGGEEFLIVCPETDMDEALTFAENLRSIIESSNFGIDRQVTASFGITEYCEKDYLDTIVQRADRALYLAKEEGRNRVRTAVNGK